MSHSTSLVVPVLFVLAGCAVPPPSAPPTLGTDQAFVRFDYRNNRDDLAITLGQVISFDQPYDCDSGVVPIGGKRLFLRAKGNPLVADINAEGALLPAGKPVFLVANAVIGVTRLCDVWGTLRPRGGASYDLRFTLSYSGNRGVC